MTTATTNQNQETERVFDLMQIGIAALIAGPIGAFIMVALNFRTLGHQDKVVPAGLAGLGLAIIQGVIANLAPNIHVIAVTVVGTLISLGLANSWQGKMITAIRESGVPRQGFLPTFGLIVLGIVFALVIGVILLAILQPNAF